MVLGVTGETAALVLIVFVLDSERDFGVVGNTSFSVMLVFFNYYLKLNI